MSADLSLFITLWSGIRVSHGGRRVKMTWDELCAWLSPVPPPLFLGEGTPQGALDAQGRPICDGHPEFDPGHPGWSPAVFRADRRVKANVDLVYALTVEHDGGLVTEKVPGSPVSPDLALAILRARGVSCVLITTKSHTPTDPHWRLVIRLSRPVNLEERTTLVEHVSTWGLSLKQAESKNAACFWFTTCHGAHPDSGQAFQLSGVALDVDAVLPQIIASSSQHIPSDPALPGEGTSSYVRKALDSAYESITRAGKGARHSTLTREAFSLGGLVGGGYLSRVEAESVLLAACDAAWADPRERAEKERDGYRTARGQLAAGEAKPRTVDAPTPTNAVHDPYTHDSPEGSHLRGRIRVVPKGSDPVAEQKAGILTLLLRAQSGAPRKVIANATTILSLDPRWIGVLAYNALSDRVVKLKAPTWHSHDAPTTNEPGLWTDQDTTRLQAWLSREYGLDLGAEPTNAAVQAAAEKTWIDPLKDYFDRIRGTWDGVCRVEVWLPAVFNAPDTVYSRAIGQRWLISCVARALQAGCQVDHVLVLEGLQGKGKSTALRRLCPSEDLFFDSELALGDKDAIQVLRGKWIIELGELSALNRHELQVVKAFITRRVDTYRPSFGRRSIDVPRRFVFAGSTNERDDYLRDPTGNRRWWPVRVLGPVDLDAIEKYRDQLWAEALHLFETNTPWYLDNADLVRFAQEEQSDREEIHPWEEDVARFLSKLLSEAPVEAQHDPDRCECVRCVGVTTAAVLGGAVGLPKEKRSKGEQGIVGRILRALGWEKGAQRRTNMGRVKPFYPPR